MGLEGDGGGWSPPGGVGKAKRAQRGVNGVESVERRRRRPEAAGGGRIEVGSRWRAKRTLRRRRFANRRGPEGGGGGTSPSGGALRAKPEQAWDRNHAKRQDGGWRPGRITAAVHLGRQNNWRFELILIRTSSRA